MTKKHFTIVGIVLMLMAALYLAYQLYFPIMVANSLVKETPSRLMPENVKAKILKIKRPVNDGAAAVIADMKKSGVTIDQVLKAIDNAKEEQALAMLDELNATSIESPNQFFSIAKKHFPVDFDVEIFRKSFNEKVSIHFIKKGIRYANIYKERNEFDTETAKLIAKRILLQKEEEFNKIVQKQR